jgi:hypothetical protein
MNRRLHSSLNSIIERHGTDWLIRRIEIVVPSSGEVFISRLYQELADILRNIEETANHRQDDSEDRITVDIVMMLRQSGFNATHDTETRGHVDIRVTNKSFVWLGEAKIHSTYDWLLDGLKQLLSRYTTGRENGSGLLIYICGANAQSVMEKWRGRLEDGSECGLKKTEDNDEKLTFWSIHQHTGSGLDIRTKHIGVSLYFKPEK